MSKQDFKTVGTKVSIDEHIAIKQYCVTHKTSITDIIKPSLSKAIEEGKKILENVK